MRPAALEALRPYQLCLLHRGRRLHRRLAGQLLECATAAANTRPARRLLTSPLTHPPTLRLSVAGNCAALWMPFYRSCSAFATANLGTLDAFSHLCIDTAYGTGGHACDAAYLTLGLADVSLACHCSTPECGLMVRTHADFPIGFTVILRNLPQSAAFGG